MVAAARTLHGFACLLQAFSCLLLLCWTKSLCCVKFLPLGPALALVSALLSILLLRFLGLSPVSCGVRSLWTRALQLVKPSTALALQLQTENSKTGREQNWPW